MTNNLDLDPRNLLDSAISSGENANPDYDESIRPTSFMESLLPISNPTNFSGISDLIYALNTSDPDKILSFLEAHPRISVLTIATGFLKETQLLHNFKSHIEDPASPSHFALAGLEKQANVLEVFPSRLFNSTTSQAPSFDALRDTHHLSQISTFDFEEEDLVPVEISNSIIIPPEIAKIITRNGSFPSTLVELIDLIKDHILYENARLKAIYEESCLDEDGTLELSASHRWEDGPIKEALRLLQTLFAWSKQKSPRSLAFRPSQNMSALEHLATQTSALIQNLPPTPPNPSIPTPTEPNPFIPSNTPISSDLAAVLAFMNNLQNQQSTQQATTINRLSASLENFANATASYTSEKQRIGKQVKNTILNAMTLDGENPALQLTETMTDVLKAKFNEVRIFIDIMLKKHNAYGAPTPDLVRSLKEGKLHYDSAAPQGFVVHNLPQSLMNTPFENVDFDKLAEEQELGRNLNDEEREALYSKEISVSRTLPFLLSKMKAYAALLYELLGAGIPVTVEAENWVAFLTENLGKLQERQSSSDRDLPARLESLFAECFNDYFGEARYGVPDLEILDRANLRSAVLRGHIKPDLPKSIENVLHPPTKPKIDDRKRKPDGPNNLAPGPNRRPSFHNVTHHNQPREFLMSPERYVHTIQKQMNNLRITPPKCPNADCHECLKFIFIGRCNSVCPRQAAHTSPSGNKSRMEALRKFQQDCLKAYNEHKKPSDPDFR